MREADLRATLDLVGEAHHAESLDAFRASLLPALMRLVPSDFASYNEVPHAGGEGFALVVPELPAWAYAAWDRLAMQNPIVGWYASTLDGRAYRFSDLIDAERLRSLDLFREIYEPLGIGHQIAVGLSSPPRMTIGIALSRGGEDFSQRDRDVLDLARPHLIQAYRNIVLRERAERVIAAVRRGLDDGGTAMVVVDDDHAVGFATRSAEAAVASLGDAELREGEPLPAPLAAVLADGGTGMVEGGERPLLVRRVRRRDGAPDVLLLEPGARGASLELLQQLGLTAREAEVLQGMMRGRATAELAAALGISRRTVHKHAERIFAKLGAHDRVEAVAVAWASIDDTADP